MLSQFVTCPELSNFESNCLELITEWNYEKNQELKPQMFTKSSSKKVWWLCEKGHEWEAQINKSSRGCGRPILFW